MKSLSKRLRLLIVAVLACVTACCLVTAAACSKTKSSDSEMTVRLNTYSVPLTVGSTETLIASATTEDGEIYTGGYVWSYTGDAITISSNDALCIVTAVKVGSSTVTVTVGNFSASCSVTVIEKNTPEYTVDSVSVNPTTASLEVGNKRTLSASVQISGGGVAYDGGYAWSVAGDAVTIEPDGNNCTVTAVKAGEATVTVTVDGGQSAICRITVSEPTVKEITVSPAALELEEGEDGEITVTVTMSNGTTSDAYTCECSEDGVVEIVKEGNTLTVTAVTAGSVTLTLTAEGDESVTAVCEITVSDKVLPTVTAIGISKETLELETGERGTLTVTVTMSDESSPADYEYTLSEAGIVEITKNGSTLTVTAIGEGTAVITVSAGEKSATCSVTVKAPEPEPEPEPEFDTIVGTWVSTSSMTFSIGWSGPGATLGGDVIVIFTSDQLTIKIANIYAAGTTNNPEEVIEKLQEYYGDDDGIITISEIKWSVDSSTGEYSFISDVSSSEGYLLYDTSDISVTLNGDEMSFKYEVTHMDHPDTPSPSDVSFSFQGTFTRAYGDVVGSVTLSDSEMYLKPTDSATITAKIVMITGTYADAYEWQVSGDDVISIDGTGDTVTVTTKSTAGTATITLSAGGKTVTCIIYVVDVSAVTVTGQDGELNKIGDTAEITASVTVNTGSPAYGGGYTWTSANPEVATVESDGTAAATVTITGEGSATITVTLETGETGTYCITIVHHDHSYTITSWEWKDDDTCEVTLTCSNGDGLCYAVTMTDDAIVTSQYYDATCTGAGYTEYTASYELGGTTCTYEQTKIVTDEDAPALGHSYEAKYVTTSESNAVEADGWYLVCSACGDMIGIASVAGYTFTAASIAELSAALEYDGAYIVLGADMEGAITIDGVSVTIDLGGKTLTAGTSGENTVTVGTGASLTILDSGTSGAIKNVYTGTTSTDNAAAVFTTGTLVIESGSVESTSVGIRAQGGEVTINGGEITATYFTIWEDKGVVTVTINNGVIKGENKGIFVSGDSNFGYADKSWQGGALTILVINDGTISCKNDSAICTLGYTSAESAYIEINGGTIYSEYRDDTTAGSGDSSTRIPAIFLPDGTLRISGGDISGATALEVRGGYVTVTGGTFNTTAQATNTPAYQGSGATSYGYALAIYPFGNYNGRYTGTANGTPDENFDWTTFVVIYGGTFNGEIFGVTESTYTEGGVTYNISFTLEIRGGSFASDPTQYLVAGYAVSTPQENETDFYIVSLSSVSVGTYDEFTSALENNVSVVLTADISGVVTVKSGTTVVIDLNGHSITYDGTNMTTADGTDYQTAYTIMVEKGATLTIKDSASDTAATVDEMGSVVMSYDKSSSNYSDMKYARRFAAIKSEGTLVVESGYIKSSSVGIVVEGSETYALNGTTPTGGYLYVHGGYIDAVEYSIFEGAGENVVVYIDGGYVSGGRGICVDGDAYFGYDSDAGTRNWQDGAKTTLNVYEGATIVSEGRSAISTLGYANAESTYVNIFGGKILGEDLSVNGTSLSDSTDFATVYIPNGILTISGGEIVGTYALRINGGTAEISGGTIMSTGADAYDFAAHAEKPQPYALAVIFEGTQSPSGRSSVDNALTVTVSGGVFTGAIECDDSKATEALPVSFTIRGGYYDAKPSSAYIADGYKAEKKVTGDLNGYYHVVEGVPSSLGESTGMLTVDGLVAGGVLPDTTGTSIGTTEIYAGGDGTKITIVSDSTNTKVQVKTVSGKSYGGISFGYGIYFNGSGTSSDMSFKFEVVDACEITVYIYASSSTKDVSLYGSDFVNKDTSTPISSVTVGTDVTAVTFEIDTAGTYYIAANGVTYTCGMGVEYPEDVEEVKPVSSGMLTIDGLVAGGVLPGTSGTSIGTTEIYAGKDGTKITIVSDSTNSKDQVKTISGKSYDGISFEYGIYLNGSGTSSDMSFMFEVVDACEITVYIYASTGTKDVSLYDSGFIDKNSSTPISSVTVGTDVTAVTFEIDTAGTYYIAANGTTYTCGIGVEYPPDGPVDTGLLTIDDMIEEGMLSTNTNFESGETTIYEGKDGTIISVVSNGSNSKTSDSKASYGTCVTAGKVFTNCINLNGSMASNGKSIKLEVTGACTITVYGMTTSANKNIKITDEACEVTYDSYNTVSANTLYMFELHIDAAGTYLLGGDGTAWIFAIGITYD